jgi:pimeloyl-ACP methyl ester carboxylesterase
MGVVEADASGGIRVRRAFTPSRAKLMHADCSAQPLRYVSRIPGLPDLEIEGFLFTHARPLLPLAGAPRFALIYAHGGPSMQVGPWGDPLIQLACKLGYPVFAPNVRGSYGYGDEFLALNDKDWGGGDVADYVAARDFLAGHLGLEPGRIGIIGFSYGGYVVSSAMVRPGADFAFGIGYAGIADLLEHFETTTEPIRSSTIAEMGDPRASAEIRRLYEDRSPITHAASLARPLYLLHGTEDCRVTAPQASRFHARLQELGRPSTLGLLPGLGHLSIWQTEVASAPALAAFTRALHAAAPLELREQGH